MNQLNRILEAAKCILVIALFMTVLAVKYTHVDLFINITGSLTTNYSRSRGFETVQKVKDALSQ